MSRNRLRRKQAATRFQPRLGLTARELLSGFSLFCPCRTGDRLNPLTARLRAGSGHKARKQLYDYLATGRRIGQFGGQYRQAVNADDR